MLGDCNSTAALHASRYFPALTILRLLACYRSFARVCLSRNKQANAVAAAFTASKQTKARGRWARSALVRKLGK